jgi:adenosylcobyric acid synthase
MNRLDLFAGATGRNVAKAVMIQGTGSGAGKSLIAAALCRIFSDKGMRVAPFKAQNMALNSFITHEGGEIGRAQALQAEAARVLPGVDMNPILLKASGDMGSQVIMRGRAYRHMKATEYYAFRNEAWKTVVSSYRKLSKAYDVIVLEGAGSPAEINLMDVDIVNMAAAKLAKAPVYLVGDIDKGGVFASLYGTVKLLGRDGSRIHGFIINKFRGDPAILDPGLDMISRKTGKPVIGVLPYVHDLGLPEEDGLGLRSALVGKVQASVRIVVVRLKYISNFTDFDPLAQEPDVDLLYSNNPSDIENADMVIIPGSKNTVKDLLFLKDRGLDASIGRAFANGIQVMGMCGGYQMLGKKILDPHGVESGHAEVAGLGLLDIETLFEKGKITCQAEADLNAEFGMRNAEWNCTEKLNGYEIHMGTSTGAIGLFRVRRYGSNTAPVLDGSRKENCWGTYLHGIFDNNDFRRNLLNGIRESKGLPAVSTGVDYTAMKEKAIDNLASMVRKHLDIDFIMRSMDL